jgi:hypothetical protein
VAGDVIRRSAVPVAGLLGAAALALLASGAFAVGHQLRTGSRPAGGLGARIAARLAGTHTQRPLAEALRLLEMRGGTVAAQVQRRERAAAILTALSAAGNARAANLLGVLDTQQAALDRKHAEQALAAARTAFAAAVRADPQGEDAKYNLELLLSHRADQARRQAEAQAATPRRGRSSHHPPGSGY